MMMQKLNARIVSLLLILVFLQKLGLELWLHNLLHETTPIHAVASGNKGKPVVAHQAFQCSCLEDALMPFTETDPFVAVSTPQQLIAVFLTSYSFHSAADREYSSLRGPPATSPLS
jgi:hypothetical protein